MKEIMDTSLVEGYIFFFEVLDMVGKECQHMAPHDEKIGNWQACFLLGHGTYDEKTHKIKMGVERLARPISQNEEQLWNMPYLSAWLPLKTSDG